MFDSTEEMGGEDLSPEQQTEQLLQLVGRLFHTHCEEREIPLDQAGQVNPINFLEWLKEHIKLWNVEDVQELCEEVGCATAVFDRLVSLSEDPTGPNQLAGVWPQVTLAFRGSPQNELASIHSVVLLKWRDGRVVPLSSFVPAELSSVNGELSDGNVCTLIQVGARNIMEMVVNFSLDDLHDHKSSYADDQAYEMLMGLVIKMLQGAIIIDPTDEDSIKLPPEKRLRLRDDLKPRVQDVMRVFQSMFRPPIAPEVQKQINAMREQQVAAKQQAKPPAPTEQDGPVRGGWE